MHQDTICAIATAQGSGAIAVIRLSGQDSIAICDSVFKPKKAAKKLVDQKAYTIHYGQIVDEKDAIDEVLISIFKAPNSYTGENSVEISCHGSEYIQQQIIQLLIKKGARLATPGEFTMRAFMNGKMDLSQAEAVADLIASSTKASHKLALQQLRGGFSSELQQLRTKLVNFISLIELELDFSEEDVEFADRTELKNLVRDISVVIQKLKDSFAYGNAIKNGIPVAIVGEPNVGKSTLLNALLNEERAIVSDIPGTTRDAIEDVISIGGIAFRFIDTAGLRQTNDVVENLGIERTQQKIDMAEIVILVADNRTNYENLIHAIDSICAKDKKLIVVHNKSDLGDKSLNSHKDNVLEIAISAKNKTNIVSLTNALISMSGYSENRNEIVVTNHRHFEALNHASVAISRVGEGLASGLSGDLLAFDIREVLHYIGEITGEVTNHEILGNIFANFCIGK